MTIKIVLPECDSHEVRTGMGTRVYTESGCEIENVSDIKIHVSADSVITATMEVAVYDIHNIEGLELLVSKREKLSFIKKLKLLFFP